MVTSRLAFYLHFKLCANLLQRFLDLHFQRVLTYLTLGLDVDLHLDVGTFILKRFDDTPVDVSQSPIWSFYSNRDLSRPGLLPPRGTGRKTQYAPEFIIRTRAICAASAGTRECARSGDFFSLDKNIFTCTGST